MLTSKFESSHNIPTTISDAKEIGILQKELKMMSRKLVEENHLDFYFVRKEWATITDPSPREKEVCERAIAIMMKKSK